MTPLLRRDFLRLAAISPIAYAPLLHTADSSPEVAFTFDDPKLDSTVGLRKGDRKVRKRTSLPQQTTYTKTQRWML